MNTPIAVGIIGCGAIAQITHIPYVLNNPERYRLIGLADLNEALLQDVADRFQIEGRYSDHRRLLEAEDLEAVIICHSGSHYQTVMDALAADKHIFVEKPLAWNLREAEEIADRAAESKRIVQVGYHKLYDPAFPVAKQYVDEMRDLGFVRISVLHPTNELGLAHHRLRQGNSRVLEGHVDPGTWRHQLDMQLAGMTGGALAPLVDEALGERKHDRVLRQCYGTVTLSLIHNIYMMYGFLGDPKRVRAAEIWREGMSIHVLVEYSDKLCCSLDWHFLSHLKDYREEYLFVGNHERVTLQFPSPYFIHFPSPVIVQGGEGELAWEKRIIVSYEEAFHSELRSFQENVRAGREPMTSVSEALKHIRFSQKIIQAIRQNGKQPKMDDRAEYLFDGAETAPLE
jgi:myo-inositol 2-dehydrogenase/D-chiro-inositol 1-dehydrogenase